MKRTLRAGRFSAQMWLLAGGTFLGSLSLSLIWPFLTIYIREQLDVPLTTVTSLFTLQSVAGLAGTMVISPLMDHFGRRNAMVIGLVASSLNLVAMSGADTLWQWAILVPLYGVVNSVFRIGSYAMVADMVDSSDRAEVFALLRMGDNLGIALGPALGGLLISVGYTLTYLLAAAIQVVLAVFVLTMLHETLPEHGAPSASGVRVPSLGYGPLLRDRVFMSVWGFYILVQIANSMVFMLLGVYVKENYAINEEMYGWIIVVNAVLIVAFQYAVTRRTDRHAPLPVLMLGALLYAAGLGIFALSRDVAGFVLGMSVLTFGEMVIVPTATTVTAHLAPVDMRARYMGAFSLSFRIGSGVGPVAGGWLSEAVAPAATWYGGGTVCLIAAAGYLVLGRIPAFGARLAPQPVEAEPTA
ncbi:MDR family MFS transporter [Aggregatilinea lenta]|uniref:MDR family MFS transporter n=1 Tax=Aggregatilinea lenta TaxID=913108 RepID=UPI0013C34FAF|nr:MFS transporter [Aggregatilinea lenta]